MVDWERPMPYREVMMIEVKEILRLWSDKAAGLRRSRPLIQHTDLLEGCARGVRALPIAGGGGAARPFESGFSHHGYACIGACNERSSAS